MPLSKSLGVQCGEGEPERQPRSSLTRMKRHSLANFWCSWMVEKTDSTRQLKTRRNLEREHVGTGVGVGWGEPSLQRWPPLTA